MENRVKKPYKEEQPEKDPLHDLPPSLHPTVGVITVTRDYAYRNAYVKHQENVRTLYAQN